MENFIEDQIKRNIANRVFIEKSMGKDISDESCLDVLEKAGKKAQLGEVRTWGGKEYVKTPKGWRPKPKGYKEKEGEKNKLEGGEKELELFNKDGDQLNIRVYKDGGVKVEGLNVRKDFDSKTEAWNFLVRNGYTTSKKETTPKGNPVIKPEKITPKNITDQLKVGDHVMYNGKEMILTRISKDGRFQNGIEMKFAKEGETTPTGSKTKVGNMMYATPIDGNARENKFVPLFGGNEGRIIDTKPNGDLIVEYRRKGEKNWTDTVKVGSDDYKNLTDSWGKKDNKHSKFEDKGGGKFELEIPGRGGAQISEGDGKFEVKVWDENYKYITDDSKRHVFDSKSEAEDFARILLDKK